MCDITTEYPNYEPCKFEHSDKLGEIEKLNENCIEKINASKYMGSKCRQKKATKRK